MLSFNILKKKGIPIKTSKTFKQNMLPEKTS